MFSSPQVLGTKIFYLHITVAFGFAPKALSTSFAQLNYEYEAICSPNKFINKIKRGDYVEVTEPTSKHGILMTTTENTLE